MFASNWRTMHLGASRRYPNTKIADALRNKAGVR